MDPQEIIKSIEKRDLSILLKEIFYYIEGSGAGYPIDVNSVIYDLMEVGVDIYEYHEKMPTKVFHYVNQLHPKFPEGTFVFSEEHIEIINNHKSLYFDKYFQDDEQQLADIYLSQLNGTCMDYGTSVRGSFFTENGQWFYDEFVKKYDNAEFFIDYDNCLAVNWGDEQQ